MFFSKKALFPLGILLCLLGFFIFAKIVSEILEGESHVIDRTILLLMRDPQDNKNPWGPGWFQEMMRDVTGLGGIAVLTFITVASIIYLIITKKRNLALYVSASVGTGLLLSNFLKYQFDRPRPDLVPYDSIIYTASLPSGHALMSAVVYLTLGALLAETQTRYDLKVYFIFLAIITTLLVGLSRIYLGVHWPSDVLTGWLAGASWALMFWLIMHFSRRKLQNTTS